MQTQWIVGFQGPTGLRYESLYPHLDRLTHTQAEWGQLFEDVQILELAALRQMNDDREAE